MKKALILLNMGGATNEGEIKMFLTNMFNDKNIIPAPVLIRKLIAYLITKKRFPEAVKNYQKIGGSSPIVGHTFNLVAKLQKELDDCHVAFVMRYTPPQAAETLKELQAQGYDTLCLIPLYPHYSGTTTRSSLEDIDRALKALHYTPKRFTIDRFYHNDLYNEALAETVREALKGESAENFDLIFSAHSLPKSVIDKGDPYQKEIEAHAALLEKKLAEGGMHFHAAHLAYQSKLGPVKWLEPSLEEVLGSLEHKKVLILPISFTIDNSETDFELAIEYREFAAEKGFVDYRVCRCPNDSDAFVRTLKSIYTTMA